MAKMTLFCGFLQKRLWVNGFFIPVIKGFVQGKDHVVRTFFLLFQEVFSNLTSRLGGTYQMISKVQ